MNFNDELDLGTLDAAPELVPQAVVVNETSKAVKLGGKLGHFNIVGTHTNFKSFTAVVLDVKTKRVWFMGNGTSYFCRSDDSNKPIQSSSENYKQQAPSCGICPKAKWNGRQKPPDCQNSLDLTLATLTDGVPKVLEVSFKSSGMKEIKNALEYISENGGLTFSKLKLETQIIEGRNFDYFTVAVGEISQLTDEERGSILPLVTKYSPKTETIHLEQPAEIEITSDEVSSFSNNLIEIDLE